MSALNKINKMLSDVDNTKDYNLKSAITERLNKSLNIYLQQLQLSYEYAITKAGKSSTIKELIKH